MWQSTSTQRCEEASSCLNYTSSIYFCYLSSANVLLDQTWRAKLTDFGVARALSMGSSTAATQRIVGTRVYMAPEYCTGLVSPAADVYSLGVVSCLQHFIIILY